MINLPPLFKVDPETGDFSTVRETFLDVQKAVVEGLAKNRDGHIRQALIDLGWTPPPDDSNSMRERLWKERIAELERGLKVALFALKKVDGDIITVNAEQGFLITKEMHLELRDAERTIEPLLR